MYALTRTFSVPANKHTQAAAAWKETVLPHLQQQDGFRQGYLLQNHGSFMVMMIWDTEAAFNRYHDSPAHGEIHGWLHTLKQGAVQKASYTVID